MDIRAASATDLPSICRLLEAEGLPLDGVSDHLETMVVATDEDAVIGAAGVELHADAALLRSVVVAPDAKGRGLGRRLSDAALDIARSRGARTAFLLTTTAEAYFPKLGFERIARAEVPGTVQASVEFQSACPSSAIVMRKPLLP